jgi:hypothetical protein
MKYVLYTLLGMLGLVVMVFFLNTLGLASFKFFEPKMENARREVYENTQSYVEGKRQELTKYRLEYLESKDPQARQAIRMTILQSMANLDPGKLPYDLENFLASLKEAQ